MKCREAYHRICDSLDADPNSAECRQVLRHLEKCPDCYALLDSVKKTIALHKTVSVPGVSAPTHRRLVHTINLAWSKGPRRTTK